MLISSNIGYGVQKKEEGDGGAVMGTRNGIHVENVEITDVTNIKISTRHWQERNQWCDKKKKNEKQSW